VTPRLSTLSLLSIPVFVYSEDDVYISNSSTIRSSIPTDCNLFGNKFEADYPVQKININITETGTFWVGARIGFERNINPLEYVFAEQFWKNDAIMKSSTSLQRSLVEDSCSCLKSNHVDVGLSKTKICKHPQNGLCYEHNCVVYERGEYHYIHYISDTLKHVRGNSPVLITCESSLNSDR
ncbi:hypothetical protein AM593_01026, partial [Mytilus galloprovincialis]